MDWKMFLFGWLFKSYLNISALDKIIAMIEISVVCLVIYFIIIDIEKIKKRRKNK